MYQLTKYEQETTIGWSADEKLASIDTANPAIIRKLDKLVSAYPDTYICTFTDSLYNAKKYTVPVSFIRFGKPASEARRAASARSLLQARSARATSTNDTCPPVLDKE